MNPGKELLKIGILVTLFAVGVVAIMAISNAANSRWPAERPPNPTELKTLVGVRGIPLQDQIDMPSAIFFGTNQHTNITRSTRYMVNDGSPTVGGIIIRLPVATNNGASYNVGETHTFKVHGTNKMFLTNVFSQSFKSTNELAATDRWTIVPNAWVTVVSSGTNWEILSFGY